MFKDDRGKGQLLKPSVDFATPGVEKLLQGVGYLRLHQAENGLGPNFARGILRGGVNQFAVFLKQFFTQTFYQVRRK